MTLSEATASLIAPPSLFLRDGRVTSVCAFSPRSARGRRWGSGGGGRERTGPRFHLGAYPDAVAVGIPMCIPGVRPKNETSARVSGIRGHRANRSVREPGGRSLHEEWQEAQGPQLARPRGRFRGRLRGTGGGGADPASSPLTRIGTCGTCAAGLSRGAGAREERACAPLCLHR